MRKPLFIQENPNADISRHRTGFEPRNQVLNGQNTQHNARPLLKTNFTTENCSRWPCWSSCGELEINLSGNRFESRPVYRMRTLRFFVERYRVHWDHHRLFRNPSPCTVISPMQLNECQRIAYKNYKLVSSSKLQTNKINCKYSYMH
jgi:hypothetical protein